jgi:hypothetical protein
MILLVSSCAQQAEQAPAPTPQFRIVTGTHEVMEGLVAPAADTVWKSVGTIVTEKGIEEIRPKDDVEWEIVEHAALGVAEAGNLLLLEGRAVDQEDWVKFTHDMMDKAVEASKIALAKDADQMLVAGSNLYETCVACHMKYIQGQ